MGFIRAKKSLGQHFLNSPSVLAKIIVAAKLQLQETVLEIGPGTGVLTKALLEAGDMRVVAVEKDHVAFEFLKIKFDEAIRTGRLKLIEGDILDEKNDPRIFPSATSNSTADTKFVLVANIPYYITGAILEKFLEHGPRPDRMVLLVQKEVAERIVTREGKESILSISVKAFGTPRIIAPVPPAAFSPPPSVDSAILSIENISDKNFHQHSTKRFFEIVRAGFAHKRKFLIRNLETIAPAEKLRLVWARLTFNEKVRPEDIDAEGWLRIASLLDQDQPR